jgi:tight adherence protein B
MKWIIVLLFAFSSFLLFSAVLQMLFSSNKKMDKRIKRYLNLNDSKALSRKKFNLLLQMQLYKENVRENVLTKHKNQKLENMLARAGVSLKPEEYIIFQWISTALGGGLLFLVSGNMLIMPLGLMLGYLLPRWWIGQQQRKRLHKFNDGLQDLITTVIGSLRAGFSFAQALKTVVDEAESPIKEEMDLVLREMQYGSTMEDALNELKERMPSEDLDLLIQSILIQKQIGGNLATILETIVQTIRDRNKIQRQIRTLTAQGRLSGIVIGLLPVVLTLVLYLLQPSYIGTLFKHPIGIAMVVVAVISGSIGMVLVRKMTKIEV